MTNLDVLEYRDFNQDGYMDVMVRRTLGGSAAPSEVLILSRRKSDGPFYVVDTAESQIRIDATESHRIPHEDSIIQLL